MYVYILQTYISSSIPIFLQSICTHILQYTAVLTPTCTCITCMQNTQKPQTQPSPPCLQLIEQNSNTTTTPMSAAYWAKLRRTIRHHPRPHVPRVQPHHRPLLDEISSPRWPADRWTDRDQRSRAVGKFLRCWYWQGWWPAFFSRGTIPSCLSWWCCSNRFYSFFWHLSSYPLMVKLPLLSYTLSYQSVSCNNNSCHYHPIPYYKTWCSKLHFILDLKIKTPFYPFFKHLKKSSISSLI